MTYRSKLGVLCLVRVVIQTNEVKSRLHLIAAAAEHVISADTLTAHLVTPVGREGRKQESNIQVKSKKEEACCSAETKGTQPLGAQPGGFTKPG